KVYGNLPPGKVIEGDISESACYLLSDLVDVPDCHICAPVVRDRLVVPADGLPPRDHCGSEALEHRVCCEQTRHDTRLMAVESNPPTTQQVVHRVSAHMAFLVHES